MPSCKPSHAIPILSPTTMLPGMGRDLSKAVKDQASMVVRFVIGGIDLIRTLRNRHL